MIERYKQRYGKVGMRHQCYFLPGKPYKNGAVLHQRIPWITGIHMIAWPSVIIGLGLMLCLGMCIRERCCVGEKTSVRLISTKYSHTAPNYVVLNNNHQASRCASSVL